MVEDSYEERGEKLDLKMFLKVSKDNYTKDYAITNKMKVMHFENYTWLKCCYSKATHLFSTLDVSITMCLWMPLYISILASKVDLL